MADGRAAAVEVEGVASLGGQRADVVRPLASVTKFITALVVLHQHPLDAGQSGPSIRFTAAERPHTVVTWLRGNRC